MKILYIEMDECKEKTLTIKIPIELYNKLQRKKDKEKITKKQITIKALENYLKEG